jgi:transcriptional regulator with XRE-family HTH domain
MPRRKDEEPGVFGKRLRQRREEVGLTVGQLAQRVGLTEGAIRAMELGSTKNAVLPNGLVIAHALGVSPWWLVAKEEPRPGSALAATGPRKTEAAAAQTLVVEGRSEEALVAAILSRLSDPSDDDFLDALLTRLEPYVLEAVRTAVQSAVQASTRNLRQQLQVTDKRLLATDQSLLTMIERLTLVERTLSERGLRPPKDRAR